MQGATAWTGSLDLNTTFDIQRDMGVRQSGRCRAFPHSQQHVCVCADLEVKQDWAWSELSLLPLDT